MKWILFAISLFVLWVAFNALFMAPGPYSAFKFEVAGVGIALGVLTAWLSGKRFADAEPKRRRSAAIMKAPPVVLCIFILFVFCAIGVVKFMAYR
jgi:membrane associated rhomboid family serine protease